MKYAFWGNLLFCLKKEQPLWAIFSHWFLHISWSQRALCHTQSFWASGYTARAPSRVLAPAPSSQGKPLCDGLISKKNWLISLGGPPSMVLISTFRVLFVLN